MPIVDMIYSKSEEENMETMDSVSLHQQTVENINVRSNGL